VFTSVIDESISFEGLQGEKVEFKSIESVKRAIAAISEQIKKTELDIDRFKRERVEIGFAAGTQALRGQGGDAENRAKELTQDITDSEARLGKLRETLAAFEAQTSRFKASEDLKSILSGLGDVDIPDLGPDVPGIKFLNDFTHALRDLKSVDTPDFSNIFGQKPESELDKVIIKLGDVRRAVDEGILTSSEGARKEFSLLQQQLLLLSSNGVTGLDQLIERMNQLREGFIQVNETLSESVGSIEFFGGATAQAIGDILTGFEKLEDIGKILGNIFRDLASQIAAAAIKATALKFLFPGQTAGKSIGGLIGGFLGLKPFASGGIVTGPTPALIGEAGPEAVIPLSRLSGINKVQLEATTLRFDGSQFLVDIRQAQNTRGVGGISLG